MGNANSFYQGFFAPAGAFYKSRSQNIGSAGSPPAISGRDGGVPDIKRLPSNRREIIPRPGMEFLKFLLIQSGFSDDTA
jgi:hypothetical protein